MCLNITKFFLLRVNSRVSAKIILVLGPNFGNPQSHGSKTPNRLRKFRNGTCNSNNFDEKYGNTGLSTLHFRTLQIFTITQTRKIDQENSEVQRCNSNNVEEKSFKFFFSTLSTLHLCTLQIFTITQTQKID